ncbi:MAG: signal peptidase I [Chloroflexi bacterium]|nr:signal peptidase I [Chloroflexota bacterium]
MELPGETASTPMWPEGEVAGKPELENRIAQADLPRGRSAVKGWLLEFLQTVLLTVILFAAVRSVVQNFQIDGPSMQPTLRSGQYLLVNKMTYLRLEGPPLQMVRGAGLFQGDGQRAYPFGGPQRGDIIVFREPIPPYVDLVKRVIALPGDQVVIDRGRVYVNGTPLEEEYVRAVPSYSLSPQQVPPGSFFVLGDNRPVSSDSHLWGFVPEANVIGKAWVRYWPPEQWGVLANPLHAKD